MAVSQRNIFVVALSDYQRRLLERLPRSGDYAFHELLPQDRLRGVSDFHVGALLEQARQRLRAFDGPVHGVTTFIDFPALELSALLAADIGLPGPGLESLLGCSHKYWSRCLQRQAVPEHVPPFAAFDPFDPNAAEDLEKDLGYPFWIKPVNAFRSHLGYRIDNRSELEARLPELRAGIERLAEPFARFLGLADLPAEISALPAHTCLAEGMIGGRQATLEGYVYRGAPRVYAVVDSVTEANRVSFARYQYPSALPARVQERMREVAERAVTATGLDNAPFNAELYWDPDSDRIWLLEINPRISESHCELLEKVDGASHQQVAIDLAEGRRPDPPHRKGAWPMAAKFFVRAFRDSTVARLPDPERVREVEGKVPGTTVELRVRPDEQLHDLQDQDSYSYELAWVWVGGEGTEDLLARYRRVKALLGIEMADHQEIS
ncbi:MAG: ATP-grasp domain-containing protein [Thiohalorhabdus sp.]